MSACNPIPYDGSGKVVVIPSWYVIQIKNIVPHSTHELRLIKGVIFCNACGAYSVNRCRLFAHACTQTRTVASERAINKLKNHQLPTRSMQWPDRQVRLMQPAVLSSSEPDGAQPILDEEIAPLHPFDDPKGFSQDEFE